VGAARTSTADLDLSGEEQRDCSQRKDHADHGERVAEAEDERLAPNGRADRSNCLVLCHRGIGHAMRHEILRQLVDPVAHFIAVDRDGLPNDIRMELFALGQHCRQRGRANRAAEIAQHVRKARCRTRLARRDAGR